MKSGTTTPNGILKIFNEFLCSFAMDLLLFSLPYNYDTLIELDGQVVYLFLLNHYQFTACSSIHGSRYLLSKFRSTRMNRKFIDLLWQGNTNCYLRSTIKYPSFCAFNYREP